MEYASYSIHPNFRKGLNKRAKEVQEEIMKYPTGKFGYMRELERLKIIENEIILQCHEEMKAIDESSFEEINTLKSLVRNDAIKTINNQFKREEEKLSHVEKYYSSKLRHNGCIEYKIKMHHHILEAEEAAVERIQYLFTNPHSNRTICEKLLEVMIVQSLTRFIEPYVIIRVMERDLKMADKVVGKAQLKASGILGKKIIVILDKTTFLPEQTCGGVLAQNKRGTIVIRNTFIDRTRIVTKVFLPLLKQILLHETRYSRYL